MRLLLPSGWSLFGLAAAVSAVLPLLLAAHAGFAIESLRLGLQLTARSSAVLFLLAMTASAVAFLWPNAFTRWQRANRRIFGLAFAFSHLVHAGFVVAFAAQGADYYAEAMTPVMVVAGAIGYTLIILMTLTSFRAPAALIGPKVWAVLHMVGVHWLWLQFVIAFGKRATQGPVYWAFLAAFAVAMMLRVVAPRLRARKSALV
jgi:DMSO/TMAO reductase YedYZ heme-binding membrane subunit